jgi:CO/xanthine dehydrogenase Mo-binding subunit
MLHARLLRCPHAHARILRIDTSKAAALPGVHAILTKDSTVGWCTYWYMIAQPAFPEELAYAGQEVAAVAAESPDIARRAIELIEVDYEVRPAVLTPRAAARPGAPVVPVLDHLQPRDGNVQQPVYLRERGDIGRGLAEAAVVSDSTFELPTQYHVDIQTRCCIADWDGRTLTVYEASQGVWNVKRELARSLGLETEQVRVIVKYMGGGFGSKAGAQRIVHYTARLAMLAGRPVRLELTRPEEFISHPRRYGAEVRVRLGAHRDGRLTAIDADVLLDIGSGSLYAGKYSLILHQLWELYRCANVRVRITAVYTNTPPTGPQRGVLDPIASFSMESALDDLAVQLDVDPLDLRLRNYAHWYDEERRVPYTSKHLDRCLEVVAEAIGWRDRDAVAARHRNGARRRGIGLAAYCIERGGYGAFEASADVALGRDGSVQLRVGIVEIGAGQITVLPMMVAEELGLDPGQVDVLWGDTAGTQYGPSSHASRVTSEMGPATIQAAARARDRLFDAVSGRLDAHPRDLRAEGGRIFVAYDPSRSLTFAEACAMLPEAEIVTSGSRVPNPGDVIFRLFGAHAAEVEVDLDTGAVTVLRVVTSHDIGRPLNPKLVESQQHGALVMGLGYGLYEEAEIDGKTGVLLTADVHQYRIPTALETPEIQVLNVESEDGFYPYSAKPVGEAPLLGAMPVIRSAILHATGIRVQRLPMTSARILEGLAALRASTEGASAR